MSDRYPIIDGFEKNIQEDDEDDCKKIEEDFIQRVSQFHRVEIKESESNPNRTNICISQAKKRWIKVDRNAESLSVSLDHFEGELELSDILSTGIAYSHQKGRNGVKVTPKKEKFDAVHFTFHKDEPYNFDSDAFKEFLQKHYQAYLKRVGLS